MQVTFPTVAPEITQGPVNITDLVNNPQLLECTATGFPAPDISWYKDGRLISESDNIIESPQESSTTSVLAIPTLNLAASGEYFCRADNYLLLNATDNSSVAVITALCEPRLQNEN